MKVAEIGNGKTHKIAAGRKGTLTAKDLSAAPMPHWAPMYPPPGKGTFTNNDIVVVAYATDDAKAAALLPEDVQLVGIPGMPWQAPVTVWFNRFREAKRQGAYIEAIVSIPVLHKGKVYYYFPAIYVTSDSPMTGGRELGGYPKKIAACEMAVYGDLYLSRCARPPAHLKTSDPWFHELVSTSVRKGAKLASIPTPAGQKPLRPPYDMLLALPPAGEPLTVWSLGCRCFFGIGKQAREPRILELVTTPWEICPAEIYEGLDPSVCLGGTEEDPIARHLPVNSVLGGFIIKGDTTTDINRFEQVKDYMK